MVSILSNQAVGDSVIPVYTKKALPGAYVDWGGGFALTHIDASAQLYM